MVNGRILPRLRFPCYWLPWKPKCYKNERQNTKLSPQKSYALLGKGFVEIFNIKACTVFMLFSLPEPKSLGKEIG